MHALYVPVIFIGIIGLLECLFSVLALL